MISLLEQLPTLIGVAVGAISTILATTMADHGRWKRDLAVRWDGRRFEAYARFAQALKSINHLSARLTASRRAGARTSPIDRETGLALLAQAQVDRSQAWEEVLLLGDETTIEAGRRWRDAVFVLEQLARSDLEVSKAWVEAIVEADRARDRYYERARASLAVTGAFVRGWAWAHNPIESDSEG